LYTEEDGQFKLTGVEGLKTQGDIDRIQEGLSKERNDHKKTKESLKVWDGKNFDEIMAELDKIEEYKLGAEGKIDEEKMKTMVEARIKTLMAPVDRKQKELDDENGTLRERVSGYEIKETKSTIQSAVRKANTDSKIGKIVDTAMDDALMLAGSLFEVNEAGQVITKENVGVTPGITADVWLAEMAIKKPHWYPASVGSGADGGKGGGGMAKNPWSKNHWNRTEQAIYSKTHGQEKAAQMAKAAGSDIKAIEAPK